MADLDGDVLLVIAGEGEEETVLRERAAPYGERIRFAPNVRGHVEAFLSACDVLVFAPSPTEGEPRVIVMAQLVGVPVIATDSEGALRADSARAAGTIVSPSHDPRALARRARGLSRRSRALPTRGPDRARGHACAATPPSGRCARSKRPLGSRIRRPNEAVSKRSGGACTPFLNLYACSADACQACRRAHRTFAPNRDQAPVGRRASGRRANC